MKVFLNFILTLIMICSCSLFNKKVSIVQVKDRKGQGHSINTEHLIMQEKQSLSIAMLKLLHRPVDNDSVMIVQAKSLIYTFRQDDVENKNDSTDSKVKSGLLSEAIDLFSIAKNLGIKTIVLCQNRAEVDSIKTLLQNKLKNNYLVKYTLKNDLSEFKNINPIVIISEDYDSLWGKSVDSIPSRKLWYSKWVPLLNSQKSQVSKDNWIKFL